LLPPLTGTAIIGHEQSGDVTPRLFTQLLPSVTVTVIFVPVVTPVILHTLLPKLVTAPAVLVTVPVLTVTSSEYVRRFGAHVGPELIAIVGNELTVTPFDVAEAAVHPLPLV
jgi:hypothetical protein